MTSKFPLADFCCPYNSPPNLSNANTPTYNFCCPNGQAPSQFATEAMPFGEINARGLGADEEKGLGGFGGASHLGGSGSAIGTHLGGFAHGSQLMHAPYMGSAPPPTPVAPPAPIAAPAHHGLSGGFGRLNLRPQSAGAYEAPIAPPPSSVAGGFEAKPGGFCKAVYVGLNYPGSACPLNGCVNDVATVRGRIEAAWGPVPCLYLTDGPGSVGQPTFPSRAHIQGAMAWLAGGLKAGDRVFFHYSGHGSQLPEDGGVHVEADGLMETLVPGDYLTAGQITDRWIKANVADAVPEGAELVAIFDSCHSGSVANLRFGWDPHFEDRAETPTRGQVVAISGCKDDQTSADAVFNGRPDGALTQTLLQSAQIGSTTWLGLLEGTRGRLRTGGFTQVPLLSSGRPLDMGAVASLF